MISSSPLNGEKKSAILSRLMAAQGILCTALLLLILGGGNFFSAEFSTLRVIGLALILALLLLLWPIYRAFTRQQKNHHEWRQLHQEQQEHLQAQDALIDSLKKESAQARWANQAKSRHITALSHELRTPLNSILGYAQLLEGDPHLAAHLKEAASVILRSGHHMLTLIEGTLDLARIEGGRLTLQPKPIDLSSFLHHLADMIVVQAQAKGLEFKMTLNALPQVVRAEEDRLRQILLNLLGNAIKFTPNGMVSFTANYSNEMATFDIADTGIGISEQEQASIFEPFVRGASSPSSSSGSGLGLTIARMLTEVMGGEISVSSTLGKGSLFRVRLYLPKLRVPVPVPVPKLSQPLPHHGYLSRARRLLVVDNEIMDRHLMRTLLSPLGFVVEEAASGQECLAKLSTFKPDVVLMDLSMPIMDGWETIRKIRAQGYDTIHLAIVSANAFEKGTVQERVGDCGLTDNDFFTKPVRLEALIEWLSAKLNLEWLPNPMTPPPLPQATPLPHPPQHALAKLCQEVDNGYVRGIRQELNILEKNYPESAEWLGKAHAYAQSFQLNSLARFVNHETS